MWGVSMKNVPVFLFIGMLEAGKTKFIDKVLKTVSPNTKILLLLCEQGELGYTDLENLTIKVIDHYKMWTSEYLSELANNYNPDQVFIEYNAMWSLDMLISTGLPEKWSIVQRICIVDASTFELYAQNMPQLIMEKFMIADMVLFNRCTPSIVAGLRSRNLRIVNRRAEFYLENIDETIENYKIDGLPLFDLNQPIIEIPDKDFSLWYLECMDNPMMYLEKVVRFKGTIHRNEHYDSYTAVGKWIMTCCEKDMSYLGIACVSDQLTDFAEGDWIEVTGLVHQGEWSPYGGIGPILSIISVCAIQINESEPQGS